MASTSALTAADRMPYALLVAASLGSFAATASGTTRAPFLIDMARDLATSVPMVANLVALTSVSWGIASLVAGTASDRWGRRLFLVGGPLALAFALIGVSTAPDMLWVAIWATATGGCSGVYTGVIMTEVSARVANQQRGRALGWVMSGQSLTLLIGVPLAAWIGASIGWRGVNLCVAVLAIVAALSMLATTQRPADARHQGAPRVAMRTALSPMVLRLLSMGIAERICFGLAAVYYATFLQATYGLALEAVAIPLAVFAIGNIVGTVLGGQIADRWRNRLRSFAIFMLASGVVALALFGWRPDVATSVGLGFLYVLCNALCRPSFMAALANVPDEVRGTVMGLNGACASAGWIGAAALGGWMIAGFGFWAFGPLAALLALAGAVLALASQR
jgi:MFS transporter, DHA1 family, inner membrane transport protein